MVCSSYSDRREETRWQRDYRNISYIQTDDASRCRFDIHVAVVVFRFDAVGTRSLSRVSSPLCVRRDSYPYSPCMGSIFLHTGLSSNKRVVDFRLERHERVRDGRGSGPSACTLLGTTIRWLSVSASGVQNGARPSLRIHHGMVCPCDFQKCSPRVAARATCCRQSR